MTSLSGIQVHLVIQLELALVFHLQQQKIWTMIGDAEIDEGSIWEALFIKDKNIKNLVLVIDKNNVSASKKIFKKANLNPKILKNLGLKYFNIDGHNIKKFLIH